MKSESCMDKQTIEYTHTIVPASMRSPYWKYFGFPSNSANKILTRQKIICTLCATAITYNKNTSNLRTHLIARHPEQLHEMHQQQQNSAFSARVSSDSDGASLQTPNQTEGPQKTCTNKHINSTDQNMETAIKIRRLNKAQEEINNIKTSNHDVISGGNDSEIHPEDIKTSLEADIQPIEKPHFCDEENSSIIINESAYVLVASINGSQRTEDENVDNGCTSAFNEDNIDNDVDEFTDIEPVILDTEMTQKEMLEYSLDMPPTMLVKKESPSELLADMMVKDLLPFNILQGIGFKQFLNSIGIRDMDKYTIEKKVQTDFTKMKYIIKKYISSHLRQDEPYSLSIETCINIDEENIFSIYVNLINFEANNKLESILYDEFICNKEADLYDILQDFDLSHCAAIVTTEQNNLMIQNFCVTHGIEIVPCLDALLTRCVNLIFQKDAISELFYKIRKIFPNPLHIPNLHCPWSKLKLMQDLLDNLSATDMQNLRTKISADLETFIAFMNPMKITLDTINTEPLPLCTLVRPLVVKLFEEHFLAYKEDVNVYIQTAQKIINDELRNSIEKCPFFSEAVLFDGRFQHDFIPPEQQGIDHEQQQNVCLEGYNRTELVRAVSQRFQHLLISPSLDIKTEEKEKCDPLQILPQSSLRLFFHRISDAANGRKNVGNHFLKIAQPKDPIDIECRRYKCEPSLDLEQCPIYWWQAQSKRYKILSKIAKFYLCVPCHAVNWRINSNDDVEMEQRSVWQQKRKSLRYQQPVERCLWYLHYNRSLFDKIKLRQQLIVSKNKET